MRSLAILDGAKLGARSSVARAYPWIAALLLGSFAYVFASQESDWPVMIPALVLLNCAVIFLLVLSLPNLEMPVFEIGPMFAAVITLYGAIPLFQFQLRNGVYGSASDNRLWVSQPTAEEVGLIGWAHVAFLVAFAVGYLLVRQGRQFEVRMIEEIPNKQLMFAVIMLGIVLLLQFGIAIIYDLSYSTYGESYVVLEKLPQGVKQINGHLSGIGFTLKVVILCAVFLKVANPVRLVALWLGFEFVLLLVKMGVRTYFMLFFAVAVLFFHVFVRRVSVLALLGVGTSILVVFLLLGSIRNTSLEEAFAESGIWEQSNEMEAVFANALDIMQQKSRNMISLPPEAQVSELTAFIPQQLLPFQKFDYTQWYARLTYEREGHTSAFGSISQALAGYGWPELLLRGFLTGMAFAGLHRYFAKNSEKWLHCAAYAWLIAMAYHSFRATSLQPFAVFFLEALPVLLVMQVIPRPDLGTRLIRLRG